jgi:hypothetical protein
MTYVIDTNILIDHLRATGPATTLFMRTLASGRRVTGSVLTRVELWRGTRSSEASALVAVEAVVDWVPVDHAITTAAARHAERFGRSHGGDAVDYVIAATAERLGAELLTRNVRDFPMFPDLEPPY